MIKILTFIFALLITTNTSASDDLFRTVDNQLTTVIEEVGMTGAAVGIIKDGRLVFAKGYGVTAINDGEPVTPMHVFHWASVAKPLVAIAVMQLAERGEINLDGKVVDYVDYFSMADKRHRNITIRQLLVHSAGMPDVEDYQWDKPQYDEDALERWIREQREASLLFEPGANVQYSNIGYELLGAMIAEVSSKTFEDYMQDNLFNPLGMKNSSFTLSDIDPALQTVGHTDDPRRTVEHYPYNRRHAPSSTLNTNIEDMARLARALLNGGQLGNKTILSRASLEAMWAPERVVREDPYSARSLGWGMRMHGKYVLVGHSGGDDGFRSYFALIPEAGVAVLLEANDEIAIMSPSHDEPLLQMLEIALDGVLNAP